MYLPIGTLPHGERGLISDVPGVRVGHCTVDEGDCHTGVTVVLPPCPNPCTRKLTAACRVFNGFGKTLGLMQLAELGQLETPIALTSTLNVGRVHDAMVSWMLEVCAGDGVEVTSVNPVVCECNDARLSRIARRPVGEKEVRRALESARADFAEGAVGAGRGTVCYGMKGGIGSASRLLEVDGRQYPLGILVQTNYGASADFRPAHLAGGIAPSDRGSIILVLATSLPLSSRQLGRVLQRTSVGMARLGSYIGHGSGEVAVGFTTAPLSAEGDSFVRRTELREELLDLPFRAAGECAEEAILRSMLFASPDVTLDGKKVPALRMEDLKEYLGRQ